MPPLIIAGRTYHTWNEFRIEMRGYISRNAERMGGKSAAKKKFLESKKITEAMLKDLHEQHLASLIREAKGSRTEPPTRPRNPPKKKRIRRIFER